MNRMCDSLPIAFAAWHKDLNVRKHCTSGGVATALAEMTIAKGGIVVGAAYGDEMSVRHVIVSNLDGLKRIRGVKYVFSSVGREIYDGISEALKQSREVLFIGLPCQVAAMRKRFGMNDNLLLVDLICFGAPAQNLWRKYVAWLEAKRGKKLVAINPRDKKFGYRKRTYYRYDWSDGRNSIKMSLFDPYSQAFYSALAFRPCCYACGFRGENHKSDITLGDCGNACVVGLPRSVFINGVSSVVCHSRIGCAAFENLKNICSQELSLPAIIKDDSPYYLSAWQPARHSEFVKDNETLSFAELIEKYHLQVTRLGYLAVLIKRVIKSIMRRARRHR